MKQYIYFGIITLALCVACFFWGRSSIKTSTPTPIQAEINIDSLRGVWIAGKVDSVHLIDLYNKNEQLRYLVARLQHNPEHDTIYRIDTLPYVPVISFDTTLITNVRLILQMEEDTLSTINKTKVHLNAQYLGEPYTGLYLNNLSIDPIRQTVPYKEKIRVAPQSEGLLSLHALTGYGERGLGVGAYAQAGFFGGGMFLQYETKPLYFISIRLIK